MADGDLHDPTRSDIYDYIVNFLRSRSCLDLVWKYADWALQKDPAVRCKTLNKLKKLIKTSAFSILTSVVLSFFLSQTGVSIFTKRTYTKDQLNPNDVIKYLGKHSQALLLYLEHLVLEKKTQVYLMTLW